MSTKYWFSFDPLWFVLYWATLHSCIFELEKYVCILYICICCCMITGSQQWDKLSSWHIRWSFFSGWRIYTLVTQILWHTWAFTSYPCIVSTCSPAHSCPLLPLSSSFLIFLSVCAVIGRSFVIQQIPSSNLFMVVVDNKCDCSMFEPITMNPIEIMYILHWSKTWGKGDWT